MGEVFSDDEIVQLNASPLNLPKEAKSPISKSVKFGGNSSEDDPLPVEHKKSVKFGRKTSDQDDDLSKSPISKSVKFGSSSSEEEPPLMMFIVFFFVIVSLMIITKVND